MPSGRFDSEALTDALAALGARLVWSEPVELVVVGGGAALLTGLLPYRLTSDCDVALHAPREAWGALTAAARAVAADLGLSPEWLSPEFQSSGHRLPPDWRERATTVGRFGVITVLAVGRRDFIAMKLIAGRAQDLLDVRELGINRDEVEFARRYLTDLGARHPHREGAHVAEALRLLEELSP